MVENRFSTIYVHDLFIYLYRELQGVTGDYKGLDGVIRGERGLQRVTGGDRG